MSLQIWLPLTKETGLNNYGLSNLTFTSSNVTLVETDGMGSCYNNATTNGYITSDKHILLGKKQSMFCWVKPTSFNSAASLNGVCGQHRYLNCINMGITFLTVSSTTGKLSVNIGTGQGRHYNTHIGNTTLTAGNWYHVGYTYDGSTVRLYVNGKLDGTYTCPAAFKPDYFQCFAWSYRESSNTPFTGYQMQGSLNDVRAYDHVLSTKEIKELAKGLMIHYPFHDPCIGHTTNLISYPTPGNSAAAAGWDSTLHKDAIYVSGWSSGYNSGVKAPTIGWHAHWQMIEDIPTMVFPRLNYRYTADDSTVTAGRWLGISSTNNLNTAITTGKEYCISFEAKADVPGMGVKCGYYYHNGSSQSFHDDYGYAYDIPTTEWKRYTFYWTAGTVTTTKTSSIYFYGHDISSVNGTAYVRNVCVSCGNADEFISTCSYATKDQDTIIYDSSGFGHNATFSYKSLIARDETFTFDPGTKTNRPADITTLNMEGGYFRTNIIHIPKNLTISLFTNRWDASGHLLDWRDSGGSTGVQPIYLDGNKKIQYWNSTLADSTYFDYIFNTFQWYHICLTSNGSTVKLYVNGELQDSKTDAIPSTTAVPLTLLARCNNANNVGSALGDFRVYATTFSATDVKKLYQRLAIDKQEKVYAKNFTTPIEGVVVN